MGIVTKSSLSVSRSAHENIYVRVSDISRFFVPVDIAAGATIKPPTSCPSKKIKPCKAKSFRHMTEMQHHTDVQEIRVQEDRESTASGSARAIDVILQDELVDMCQAGGTPPQYLLQRM